MSRLLPGTAPGKKLRVGLLVDEMSLPAWAYHMLERIQGSDCAEVVLLVLNDSPQEKRSLAVKIRENWKYLFYIAYRKLDDRLFRSVPDAFELKDLGGLLPGVPVLKVKPRQKKFSDWIEERDIAEIENCQVDVLVRLGFRILRGKILQAARYGVWSYHHGDSYVNRGGPAGFWEVLENHPHTGSVLQILTEDLDNGQVLYRSYSATDYASVSRNRNNYYWKSLSFLPRKLEELNRVGEEEFSRRAAEQNRGPGFYMKRLYVTPTNTEFLRAFTGHLWRYLKLKLGDLLAFDQWMLLYDLRDGISGSFWRFKKIIPPKDRFWADPHALFKDGKYYIFLEEFLYASQKGHISVIVMDEKGNFSAPAKILERPYHLSYPFVFEWQGELYMMPDTSQNRTIEVYRCVEFPYRWEYHKTLMKDVTAVDSTLLPWKGKWWLFTNIRENAGASTWDELFLFSAGSPLSEQWEPHPMNPIVSDVRRARPAGRIYQDGSSLFRPAQDCSQGYGYGLKIHRIVALSETDYREEEAAAIRPDWDRQIQGTHTFGHVDRLTVIDGKMRRSRLL